MDKVMMMKMSVKKIGYMLTHKACKVIKEVITSDRLDGRNSLQWSTRWSQVIDWMLFYVCMYRYIYDREGDEEDYYITGKVPHALPNNKIYYIKIL